MVWGFFVVVIIYLFFKEEDMVLKVATRILLQPQALFLLRSLVLLCKPPLARVVCEGSPGERSNSLVLLA